MRRTTSVTHNFVNTRYTDPTTQHPHIVPIEKFAKLYVTHNKKRLLK